MPSRLPEPYGPAMAFHRAPQLQPFSAMTSSAHGTRNTISTEWFSQAMAKPCLYEPPASRISMCCPHSTEAVLAIGIPTTQKTASTRRSSPPPSGAAGGSVSVSLPLGTSATEGSAVGEGSIREATERRARAFLGLAPALTALALPR